MADLVAPARVVKAANTLGARCSIRSHEGGGQRVLFLSGNDPDANGEVAALLANAGFFPIDLGGLAQGARFSRFTARSRRQPRPSSLKS